MYLLCTGGTKRSIPCGSAKSPDAKRSRPKNPAQFALAKDMSSIPGRPLPSGPLLSETCCFCDTSLPQCDAATCFDCHYVFCTTCSTLRFHVHRSIYDLVARTVIQDASTVILPRDRRKRRARSEKNSSSALFSHRGAKSLRRSYPLIIPLKPRRVGGAKSLCSGVCAIARHLRDKNQKNHAHRITRSEIKFLIKQGRLEDGREISGFFALVPVLARFLLYRGLPWLPQSPVHGRWIDCGL